MRIYRIYSKIDIRRYKGRMLVKIRIENKKDYKIIYDFVEEAFRTAKVSDGKEQDFVNELRENKNYIEELALVGEYKGEIIGHIMLTKFYINSRDGEKEILLLAPISVKKEFRNKGIGSSLIEEGFKRAKEMGYKAVLLVGDPKYYHRFGFISSSKYKIKNISGIPDENVMIVELYKDSLKGLEGTVEF